MYAMRSSHPDLNKHKPCKSRPSHSTITETFSISTIFCPREFHTLKPVSSLFFISMNSSSGLCSLSLVYAFMPGYTHGLIDIWPRGCCWPHSLIVALSLCALLTYLHWLWFTSLLLLNDSAVIVSNSPTGALSAPWQHPHPDQIPNAILRQYYVVVDCVVFVIRSYCCCSIPLFWSVPLYDVLHKSRVIQTMALVNRHIHATGLSERNISRRRGTVCCHGISMG